MYDKNKNSAPMRTAATALLAMTVLIAGCKSTEGAMTSLKGRPVSEALAKFGSPDSAVLNAFGGQDLTWAKRSGMYNVKPCVKKVSTDKDGTIIKWSYRDCL